MTTNHLRNARAWADQARRLAPRAPYTHAATISVTAALQHLLMHIEAQEPDRSAPINIIPPTIIEGGQEHGRP